MVRVPRELWAPLAAFAGLCNLFVAVTGRVLESTTVGWALTPVAGDDRLVAGLGGAVMTLIGIVGLRGLFPRR